MVTTTRWMFSGDFSLFAAGALTVHYPRRRSTSVMHLESALLKVLSWTLKRCGRRVSLVRHLWACCPWVQIQPIALKAWPRNTVLVSSDHFCCCMFFTLAILVFYFHGLQIAEPLSHFDLCRSTCISRIAFQFWGHLKHVWCRNLPTPWCVFCRFVWVFM